MGGGGGNTTSLLPVILVLHLPQLGPMQNIRDLSRVSVYWLFSLGCKPLIQLCE